jgi:hypothetical protein
MRDIIHPWGLCNIGRLGSSEDGRKKATLQVYNMTTLVTNLDGVAQWFFEVC